MSDPSPTTDSVDIAVLANQVQHMSDVLVVQTAAIEAMRVDIGETRQMMAVNEERWRNHNKAQGQYVTVHEKLHQRERGVLGTLILVVGGASTAVSAWWNGR